VARFFLPWQCVAAVAVNNSLISTARGCFTHPVVAALDHPLSASRKEGYFLFLSSLREAERGSTSAAVSG